MMAMRHGVEVLPLKVRSVVEDVQCRMPHIFSIVQFS